MLLEGVTESFQLEIELNSTQMKQIKAALDLAYELDYGAIFCQLKANLDVENPSAVRLHGAFLEAPFAVRINDVLRDWRKQRGVPVKDGE